MVSWSQSTKNGSGGPRRAGVCFQDPHSKNGSATGTGQDMTLDETSLSPANAQMNTDSVASETLLFLSVSTVN